MNKKQFIVGSLLLGAAAVSWWARSQYKMLNKLYYEVSSYKIKSINKDRVVLDIAYQIKNKGAFEVLIRGYSFDIYGDGKYLANAKSNQRVNIAPFSTATLPIEITINFKSFAKSLGGVLSAAQNWKNIYIEMRGVIRVTKGIIPIPIPYKTGYTLKEISQW